MKVLSNCTLTKLREYSQSYGAAETIDIPYIKEYENEIVLLNQYGEKIRTLKKGTKLLISYTGEEITDRQLVVRSNKAKKERIIKKSEDDKAMENMSLQLAEIEKKQITLWIDFLANAPESKAKYIGKCNSLPSNKWRNYLRMKAAKHINNGSYANLVISAPTLKTLLINQ